MFHFQRRKQIRQKMNSFITYFCFLPYQPLIIYAKMKMISNLKMRINLFSMRVGQSRVHHGVLVFIPRSAKDNGCQGSKTNQEYD